MYIFNDFILYTQFEVLSLLLLVIFILFIYLFLFIYSSLFYQLFYFNHYVYSCACFCKNCV